MEMLTFLHFLLLIIRGEIDLNVPALRVCRRYDEAMLLHFHHEMLSSYFTSYRGELTLEEVTYFGEKDLHSATENYKSIKEKT
jgi:hypothetical protein